LSEQFVRLLPGRCEKSIPRSSTRRRPTPTRSVTQARVLLRLRRRLRDVHPDDHARDLPSATSSFNRPTTPNRSDHIDLDAGGVSVLMACTIRPVAAIASRVRVVHRRPTTMPRRSWITVSSPPAPRSTPSSTGLVPPRCGGSVPARSSVSVSSRRPRRHRNRAGTHPTLSPRRSGIDAVLGAHVLHVGGADQDRGPVRGDGFA